MLVVRIVLGPVTIVAVGMLNALFWNSRRLEFILILPRLVISAITVLVTRNFGFAFHGQSCPCSAGLPGFSTLFVQNLCNYSTILLRRCLAPKNEKFFIY